MIPRQFAFASGLHHFSPRYIVPALLLGALSACGGGGGGGGSGVATLSEYRHWLGARLQTGQSLNQQSSYALKNSNVLSAHAQGSKGRGVTVAVIDGEIDLTHPDLRNRWVRDSNGKVTGYNFVEQHSDVRPIVQRRDKPRSDISEPDIANRIRTAEATRGVSFTRSISHGTHVSGIMQLQIMNLEQWVLRLKPQFYLLLFSESFIQGQLVNGLKALTLTIVVVQDGIIELRERLIMRPAKARLF